MSKEQIRFVCDLWHDVMLWLRGKPKQEPSLLARGIQFSNQADWMERLEAYQQLTDWISVKHTNENEKV